MFVGHCGVSFAAKRIDRATGRAIVGPRGGFVEFAATFRPASEGEWIGTADGGVTYPISKNSQLDAGVYSGVSDYADDVTFFLGLTARR